MSGRLGGQEIWRPSFKKSVEKNLLNKEALPRLYIDQLSALRE